MINPSCLTGIYNHPGINDKDLQTIYGAHRKVFIKKGNFLLKEGQLSDAYYCLENGLVRAFANSSDGKDITTGFFSTNEIVIEVASLFLRQPTRENIRIRPRNPLNFYRNYEWECLLIGFGSVFFPV